MPGDTSSTRFFLEPDMEDAVTMPLAGGGLVLLSRRNPEQDQSNEDAVAVIPLSEERAVLAVADGLGGHAAGAEASRLALEAVDASLRQRAPEEELRTAILNGFEMANETVRALGVGAGTTLAVVEIDGHWARTYHVGDTGIVIVGQRGRIRTRTVDHSPTGYAVEAGLMDDRQAMHHEERHLISNLVGSEAMRIDVGPSVQMAAHDTVLVASDGLFDNLHFDEIVERVRKGPIGESVSAMARLCRQRMASPSETRPSKPDDLTIAVFRRKLQ